MRNTLLATAALAGLSGLAACNSTETTTGAAALTVEQVVGSMDRKARGSLAPQADYALVFDGLPEGAVVSVGAYEPEGSGAVARDVRIGFGESGAGIEIEELRAYDLDPAAGEAFAGEPGTTARLASRIDLRGLRFDGLETLSQGMTEGILDGMADAIGEMEIEQDFERYDYTIERMVLDGMTFAGLPAASDDAGVLQRYAQFMSVFGADRVLASGLKGDFSVRQTVSVADAETGEETTEEGTSSGTFVIDEMGAAGWRGGDVSLQFVRGMRMDMAQSQGGVAMPGTAFTLEEGIVRDSRLSEALRYLIAEQRPPADATDLLSLGKWDLTNLEISMGGQPYQTIHAMSVDATAFHGLLPERITFSSQETLHLAGLFDMLAENAGSFAEVDGEAVTPEDMAELSALTDALRSAGLEAIRTQNEGSYGWSPETGAMALDVSSVSEELGQTKLGLAMRLPTHDEFASLPQDGGGMSDMDGMGEEDGGALSALLAETAALERFELVLDDEGGLDAFLTVLRWRPRRLRTPASPCCAVRSPRSCGRCWRAS